MSYQRNNEQQPLLQFKNRNHRSSPREVVMPTAPLFSMKSENQNNEFEKRKNKMVNEFARYNICLHIPF